MQRLPAVLPASGYRKELLEIIIISKYESGVFEMT